MAKFRKLGSLSNDALIMDQNFFETVLRVSKDYWFLITLVASFVLTVGYMVFFRVNPWDQQRAAKLRRDRVKFHNAVGYSLLESGHFKEAKGEFEESLKLSNEDQTALNGKYLANLFIAIAQPTTDPAIGFAIERHISSTADLRSEEHRHIIDKYLGDLHMRISKVSEGVRYYEAALKRKPDYPNALYSMGWYYYEVEGNFDGMERMFRRLTASAPHDYRGYHGLGYALYMKALHEADPETRTATIHEAAKQSGLAKDLVFTQLNIVMDLAEVARSVNPELSVFFHGVGKGIIEDAKLYRSGDNPFPLFARLLKQDGQSVTLDTKDEKLSWVAYHTAVDFLALERMPGDANYSDDHDRYFEEAKKFDPNETVLDIYNDQRAILDALMPAEVSEETGVRDTD